ncbi:TspO/MBR family protein [Leifsonia sp. PS1209]|uniref:TspO/MBR family protein n=1 Tax=Leifsonia sp. PS1209 TaxID=2724914 RepID=UPI001442B639|nr:TspO/MBR family protein [Leifsonia sp. PS1209]QJA00343.1 tryptophan-rich sensory protein [Leifsonia sp. PS1209]
MSTTAVTDAATATRPVAADRVRQVAVVVGAVLAVIGAFIGSGAAGGTPIQKAAGGALSADATMLSPAGPAFSIWSVIYLGLLGYAIWQALPSQAAKTRQRRIGYWMLASLLLNAAWILSVQFGMLALSAVLIAALLVVLIVAFVLLQRIPGGTTADAILFDGTTGLYLGWVMVATVANVTSLLVAAGFDGFGWSPHAWGMALVVVAAILGAALAIWDRGRLAPAIASAWGLAWIGVSRLTGTLESAPVAITAIAAAVVLLMIAVAVRVSGRGRSAADLG